MASNLATLPLLPLFYWWLGLDGAGWHVILQSLLLMAILHFAFSRNFGQVKHG